MNYSVNVGASNFETAPLIQQRVELSQIKQTVEYLRDRPQIVTAYAVTAFSCIILGTALMDTNELAGRICLCTAASMLIFVPGYIVASCFADYCINDT